jgi:hypothetical protein
MEPGDMIDLDHVYQKRLLYAAGVVGTVAAVYLVVRWAWRALIALSEREPF